MSKEKVNCKVSVIIPTRNGHSRGFLSESINSVLNQSIPPDEIILINDGSCDQTESFVKTHFPNIKVHSQIAKGLPAARNSGLKICSGDLVAFLDDDDKWLPDKLEKQIKFLQSSENKLKVGVGCDSHITDVSGNRVDRTECFVESIRWPYILAVHPIWHGGSCLLLRKSAVENVGLFDEQVRFAEDYDYWIRVSKSFEIGWVREFLLERRRHSDQLTFNQQVVARNLTKVFECHSVALGETMRRRYFNFFISFQALYAIRRGEFAFASQLLTKVIFANPLVWIFHLLRPLRHHGTLGRLNQRMIMRYLSNYSKVEV